MEEQSLKPIFHTLDTENLSDPFEVADYYDILVKYSPLPDEVLGLSEPYSKTIFINETCDNPYFVCGHEVIHSILDEDSAPLLNISYVSNSKIEHRADVGSFYMLFKMVQDECDYGGRRITVPEFMERFHIGQKYFYEVEDFISKYILHK
ncbi:MAG: hypothetical protein LKF36_15385 [Lactobacillus sp.]|jgi:hypothetical protein|nr:hypothetical protein [Lactobacillus sp.]